MRVTSLHSWAVNPIQAIAIQKDLSERIDLRLPRDFSLRYVAGADVSVDRERERIYAAVVVLSVPDLMVVEIRQSAMPPEFPYVPGLLTFREGKVLAAAFEQVQTPCDLVVFDGQGLAHPRGLGIASHFGLLLGIPTVGVGKSKLVGDYGEPGPDKGSSSPLLYKGERVGTVLRTRRGVRPVFVSPGNLIDHASAVDVVLGTCTRYRLPEPTRQAHLEAGRLRSEKLEVGDLKEFA